MVYDLSRPGVGMARTRIRATSSKENQMRLTRLAVSTLMGVLVLSAPLYAAAPVQDHSAHGGASAAAPARPFGLTSEQAQAAQKIYASQGKSIWMLKQQIKAKQMELKALSVADSPDQGRIKTLARDIAGLTERKVLAEVEMRQQLMKAGVPVWGMGRMGMGGGMGGMGGMGMGGGMGGMGGCPMMSGGHGGGSGGGASPDDMDSE